MRSECSAAILVHPLHEEAQMSNSPESSVAAYFDALNRSDAAGLAALFDEDGMFMGDGAPTAIGPDQIREFSGAAFGAMRVDHDFQVDRVEKCDGLAVVQTHSAGTLTMLAAGTTENAHRELFVLRERSGKWLIAHYMYNSAQNAGGH
jgi:uncharacterized protein (TIGR02246 family)